MSPLTKMLVVLQLVFSLVLSVAVVLMVSKQEPYKKELESANAAKVASGALVTSAQQKQGAAEAAAQAAQSSLTTVSKQLEQARTDAIAAQAKADTESLSLKADIARLNAQNGALNTANTTAVAQLAAQNAELSDLRPKVADLTTKYNEVYRAKNESDNQLRASEQAIRKLQEQLQAAMSAPATTGGGAGGAAMISGPGTDQVQVLSNAASATGPINAKVGKVAESAGVTFFEAPLGARDGVKTGTKLFIYRGNSYVADAVITRADADTSVAKITKIKSGEALKEGDMVSTIGQ